MQKEHKNIDELFKSELSDHKVIAPTFVKDQLDKKLFRRKKLIFLSPLLVVLFFGAIYLSNTRETLTSNKIFTELSNQVKSTLSIKKISQSVSEEKANGELNQISAGNGNTKVSKEKTKTSLNIKPAKQEFPNKSHEIEFSFNSNTPLDQQNSTDLTLKQNTFSSQNEKIEFPNSLKELITNYKEPTTTTENHDYMELEQNQTEINQSEEINNIETIQNSNEIHNTDSTSTQIQEKDSITLDLTSLSNPKKINYLFSLNSGINISRSTYNSINSIDADYYTSNNSDNLNFEHNLSADVLLKNKFLIGSGLGTSNQSYDYSYSEITTTTCNCLDTITFIDLIYAPNDSMQQLPPIDTVYTTIVDSSTTQTTTVIPYNGRTSAQYVHIPFRVGYVFHLNKFMFGIQANVRYNIMYKSDGQYYNSNIVTSFDKSNSIFKKSYFDFGVKSDVYYNVFDQFYINTSIQYTPKTNNTYDNININRKLSRLHFGIGVSYKL